MALQLTATGADVAPTYGWDTVSAVRVADMNRAIQLAKSSPPSFTQTLDGADAAGAFGDWQIDNGGDGQLVHFALPLKNVIAHYLGEAWTGHVTARVEVQLQFVPHTDPPTGGEIPHDLVVQTTPPADGVPVASVIDLEPDPASAGPNRIMGAAISQCLQAWLDANLGQFAHVFATVNITTLVQGDALLWLKPSYATYIFLAQPNPDDSLFAILCRTGQRSPDDLAPQLSPFAIPAGARAGFLLSPARVLGDMVERSLPAVLPGARQTDFVLDETKNQLTLKAAVALDPTTDKDGHELYPSLEAFTIVLQDRELQISSTVSTPIVPGIRSVGDSQAFYHIGLQTKKDGSQTLGYQQSRPGTQHDRTEESEGMVVLEWMLAIATIIVGIATFWTGAGVGLIVVGLLLIGAQLSLAIIKYANTDDAPSIDLFVDGATGSITWAHGSTFVLTSAELNGALQLGGLLQAPPSGP